MPQLISLCRVSQCAFAESDTCNKECCHFHSGSHLFASIEKIQLDGKRWISQLSLRDLNVLLKVWTWENVSIFFKERKWSESSRYLILKPNSLADDTSLGGVRPFFLWWSKPKRSKMHEWARRKCLTICLKHNLGVLWGVKRRRLFQSVIFLHKGLRHRGQH